MKDLLKMKGDIATDIKNIENLIDEMQKAGNYTGITKITPRLEYKKDIKRLIDILYPLV